VRQFEVAVALALALVSTVGFSQTITFEDVPQSTQGNFSSGGFDFIANGLSEQVFQVLPLSTQNPCSPLCPSNGTNILLSPTGLDVTQTVPATVLMSKTGGGTFGLSGFDGAGSNNWASVDASWIPNFIDATGLRADGTTVSQSFAISKTPNVNGTLPFTNYSFTNFSNLKSVSFSASGASVPYLNGFALDNISISAVPEPETYAMMLAGLGLMGGIIRRFKARQG
jgi:hypothetical protein